MPFLYPKSEPFARMPEVFVTGFMVGLMEWCCIDPIAPYPVNGQRFTEKVAKTAG